MTSTQRIGSRRYSVLARVTPPLAPADASRPLLGTFDETRPLPASTALQRTLTSRGADLGIVGGVVYDALIATTALEHDATLLRRDRRAAVGYARVGVDVRSV